MSAKVNFQSVVRLTLVAFGSIVLAASLSLASPSAYAALAAGLAGLAGCAVMALGFTPGVEVVQPHQIITPVQIVQRVIHQPKDLRIFKLENERGYVVFQVVDGKLISKMVDAALVARMMNTASLG